MFDIIVDDYKDPPHPSYNIPTHLIRPASRNALQYAMHSAAQYTPETALRCSVVRYLRYLGKYRDTKHDDTTISQ